MDNEALVFEIGHELLRDRVCLLWDNVTVMLGLVMETTGVGDRPLRSSERVCDEVQVYVCSFVKVRELVFETERSSVSDMVAVRASVSILGDTSLEPESVVDSVTVRDSVMVRPPSDTVIEKLPLYV